MSASTPPPAATAPDAPGLALRVGFIGLGNMGAGMARNVRAAGVETVVYDTRAEAVAELTDLGATAAAHSGEACLGVEVLCVAVFDETQVRAALLGDATGPGALTTAAPGTVIAIHSTVSAAFVRELADIAMRQDVHVIDVAMTGGGDVAARAGTLTFMVGGPTRAVQRCRPVLDLMASNVFHVGETGAGVSAKIVNNFLATSNVALVREALAIARGCGFDESLLEVIGAGGVGSSWVSNNWDRIRAQEETYTTGREGMARMWAKDLALAAGLAGQHDVPTPIADFLIEHIVPEVGAQGLTG
ncbi:NAD(P)-dependent oxidoreductase [Actinomadura rugatobispora]|uniref:NAD(P)-dependent oxidoreductase n=1 Tax=Actinomadura rugatobispora TaxID=1994 RepID=A0ABW0ZWI2_9ACTN|nr:3-hydroxyisobutyrate dehydrogenase [Actinomadura rugatobispora]